MSGQKNGDTGRQRAPLITLEGIENAGKTTNSHFMRDWLAQQKIDVIIFREPGSTHLGQQLRQLLLEPDTQICAIAELLIICAARAQMVKEKLLPSLNNQTWVICDRFADSTFAYQHGGREIPARYVNVLAEMTHDTIRPDLTILFDISPQQIVERLAADEVPDRFTQENIDFFTKVRATYLQVAESEPERWRIIDASQPPETVKQSLADILQSFLLEHNLS